MRITEKHRKYRFPDGIAAVLAVYHSGQPTRSFLIAVLFVFFLTFALRHF